MSNGFYCGGLKAQMLPLAQGNALGIRAFNKNAL